MIKGITSVSAVVQSADFDKLSSLFSALGFEQGKGWEKIDTWTASGLNPGEGKFGFYLQGTDELYISNFSFTPK